MVGALLALAGGLAAGAGATHLLYRHGHMYGLELRPPRAPAVARPKTAEEYDREEPGRGRLADRPSRIPRKGWTDILWRTGARFLGDRIGFVAGGVTFFVALSLFPTLAAIVSIYGLFADPTQADDRLAFLYSVMPSGVAQFLGGEMQRLAENSTTSLTFTLVLTLLLSLWAARGGVETIIYGVNLAYSEVERRNIVTYNLLCLSFTAAGLAGVLLVSGLVVGVPVVLALIGLPADVERLGLLRWPVLLFVYVAALTLLYRFAPCRRDARLQWLVPGAVFAALLSLLLSFGFSWYLQTFVRTASYGPLAAMMGFLLWTWLTAQIVLVGATLNAEIERQTAVDTTYGSGRPIGERGAVVADTVGARRGDPAALKFTRKHAEALADRIMRRRIREDAEKW